MPPSQNGSLLKQDFPQFYLLIALYWLQGIPVGLVFGAIPFLLKSMDKETSFAALGLFSMATYPYSLKILWSPIVDSFYFKKIGRRRSWIIPIQLLSGSLMWTLGRCISLGWLFDGVDDAFRNPTVLSSTEDVVMDVTSLHNVNATNLTFLFGMLVFLCATQDIAVDGWALEILSKQSRSYASTAQTIGLNIGYFLSFTVFLALNSSGFANSYVRAIPLNHGFVSLGGYMQFTGIMFLVITVYIMLFTTEYPKTTIVPIADIDPVIVNETKNDLENKIISPEIVTIEYGDGDVVTTGPVHSIGYIYRCFWKILNLKSMKSLAIIHLIAKAPFQCSEVATNLKLLENGFKREDLAITVFFNLPFEIMLGYLIVKWSSQAHISNRSNKPSGNITDSGTTPHKRTKIRIHKRWIRYLVGDTGSLTTWLFGYLGRSVSSILATIVLYKYPIDNKISKSYFCFVLAQNLLSSFMYTVQFSSISAFHTKIADPILGGTYMTLLNTLSNFGGTWPRSVVMWMINYFTIYSCEVDYADPPYSFLLKPREMDTCTRHLKGKLTMVRDGYYITNISCILLGLVLYFGYIKRTCLKLQNVPLQAWKPT